MRPRRPGSPLGLLPPQRRAAGAPPLRAGPPLDHRPVRARRARTRRSTSGRRSSSIRASWSSTELFFDGGAGPEHGRQLLLQAACRLRPPQRPRLPAGRVAASRPLAVDRPARGADGEGARGLAPRRGRGAARRGSRVGDRLAAGLLLRRRGAGGRLDSSRAGTARPSLHARAEQQRQGHAERLVGRAGLAARARASRRCGARCARARRRRCFGRPTAPASRSLELVVVTSRVEAALVEPAARARAHTSARRARPCRGRELRRTPRDGRIPTSCACRRQACRSPWCAGETISPLRCAVRTCRRRHVRKAGRTIAVSAPALVVIAVAWLRLEQPVGSLWRVLALLLLAVAACSPFRPLDALRRCRGRHPRRGPHRGWSRSRSVAPRPPGLGLRPLACVLSPRDPLRKRLRRLLQHAPPVRPSRARGDARARAVGHLHLRAGADAPRGGAETGRSGACPPRGGRVAGNAPRPVARDRHGGRDPRRRARPARWPRLATRTGARASGRRGRGGGRHRGRLRDSRAPRPRALADVESGPRRKRADGRGIRLERAVRRPQVLRASHDRPPGAVRPAAHLSARHGARRLQGRCVGGRSAASRATRWSLRPPCVRRTRHPRS